MFVKDRMSAHPLTVSPNDTVPDVHRYMEEQHVRHMPVVRDGKMLGLVSEDDLLKAQPSAATSLSIWEIHSLLSKLKVKDVMVTKIITTTEDTPIEDAAQLLLENKIGCLPVLRGERLVGIITETDLFATFMELFAARQRGLRITLEVPDQEGELAKLAQAVADQGGYIAACGTYQSHDPTKSALVLKVRNVDDKVLREALAAIEEANIIDIRQD